MPVDFEAESSVDFQPATVDFQPEGEQPKQDFFSRSIANLNAAPASQAQHERSKSALDALTQDRPLLSISSQTVEKLLPDIVFEGLGDEGTKGVADALSGAISSFAKPSNLALIPAAAISPVGVAGYLAYTGAQQLGEKLGELSVTLGRGDARRNAQLGTEAVLSLAQTLAPMTAAHAPRASAALLEGADRVPAPSEPIAFEDTPFSRPEIPITVAEKASQRSSVASSLGIVPASVTANQAVAKEVATKLDNLRARFKNLIAADPVRQDIARTFDAADNQAKIEGEQVGNSVRLDLPDAMDRKATTFVVEANNDLGKLAQFEDQVIAGKNADALEAVRHARDNWDRLQPAAERVNELHQQQLEYEQSNGIDPGNHEAYVKHAYDMDVMLGRGRPVVLNPPSGASGNLGTAMMKQRTFATYADAIEQGYKPKTLDVADLVQSRVTAGERLVNRNQWANALSEVKDPASGNPIVTAVTTQSPKGTQVAPMGYVRGEVLPGVPIAIHEGYAPFIDSLLAPSKFKNLEVGAVPVGKLLMGTEGFIKHGMLMLDTFHAGRMIYKELALTQKLGHDMGRSLLEYSNADLARAVAQKEITQQAADFALARRPDAELLTSQGLNVGRISDALNRDVLSTLEKLPAFKGAITSVIKPFNTWVFDKLTRGAMLHSGLMELDRLRNSLPDKTDVELAGIVAKNMNAYYGNLGKQGLIRDATFQDLARVAFLAPQWVEGMARTELGAAGQAIKVPIDLAQGKGLVVGPLAKGVGTGVLAMTVATQLINLATRGHPTWQNEEHGHQMDAWIPDLTGKGPGFWMNPLSLHAELAHDALRYYSDDPHAIKVAARILGNKLSPVVHAEEVLRTGKDWMDNDLDSTWDRIKAGAASLLPAPIPLQALFKDGPPGSLQRQITASLGIKTELAQSADAQMFSLLRRYNTAQGIKNEPITPSPYRELNNALRNDDKVAAQKAFEEVSKTKGEHAVLAHYHNLPKRLYTEDRHKEAAFRATLNEAQQKLLDKAIAERLELSQKFLDAKLISKP